MSGWRFEGMLWDPSNDSCCKEVRNKKIIIPEENTEEAKLVQGIEIYGFSKLIEVIRFLEGKQKFEDTVKKSSEDTQRIDAVFDFKDVKGQKEIIETSLLAAAGGHNMLMIGEPGCGKR